MVVCMRMKYKSIEHKSVKWWLKRASMMQHFEHNRYEKSENLWKKSKYQWLNRFESSNHDVNLKDNSSIHDTEEKNITFMQRKKIKMSHQQQKQNLQTQQISTNAMTEVKTENANSSMKLASDLTYKALQISSLTAWSAILNEWEHTFVKYNLYIENVS